MAKVYRIENKYGEGPFWGGAISYYLESQDLNQPPHNPCTMPCPYSESERGSDMFEAFNSKDSPIIPGICLFAFGCVDTLKSAFRVAAGRVGLAKNGWPIKVFEVPDEYIIKGNHQIVVERSEFEKYKPVGELHPETLKEIEPNGRY